MSMQTAIKALERVFGVFEKQHGCASAELDAAERRLCVALPAALRTLYSRTGRHPFHTAENALVPPNRLDFDADHLVIYEENQGACLWGIAESALSADDPPVDVSVMTKRGIEYVAEFRSVSDLLVAQAAQQAVATLPWSGLMLASGKIAGRTVKPRRYVSRERGKAVGTLLWKSKRTEVRGRPGAIAMISSGGYFSLAARKEATFRKIAAELDIDEDDWDYFSPRDA